MRSIWIYSLDRELTQETEEKLNASLNGIKNNWKSHGDSVNGNVEVKFNRFIIVKTLPGPISGCSIDSMNREVIQSLSQLELSVLGPEIMFIKGENQTNYEPINLKELKEGIKSNTIPAKSLVLNNHIENSTEFESWESTLEESWLSRFIPQPI